MDFGRLMKIFTAPRDYWNEVVGEPGDIKTLLIPQMLILAVLPSLSWFVGILFGAFRMGPFMGRYLTGAIVGLILSYVTNIAVWIIMGIIINSLAQPFSAQKDFDQSMKLAMGAVIPMWVGGVLNLIPVPFLGMLGSLAGLGYGAYFLYLGLPVMNGTTQDKAVGYTAAVIGIMFVVSLVLAVIAACPMSCMVATSLMR